MAARLHLLLIAALLGGCFDPGEGIAPPPERVYFPVGLALDADARFLYVLNSDFDLQFNAGTLQSMDLEQLLDAQDRLITRKQAVPLLGENALRHRLARYWRIALPGVYLASTGELSFRQRQRAALLYGGPNAQLFDHTALAAYGINYLPPDETIYVLLPASDTRTSRDGVRIKRTHRLPSPQLIAGLTYCPPQRALAEFAARIANDRKAESRPFSPRYARAT